MAAHVGIFGGAGFLGSHIAGRFLAAGWKVTVVDGLLPHTGGNPDHLAPLQDRARVIARRIEDLPELPDLVADFDLVVDAMAWTAHLLALERPRYDLELNAGAHLVLLEALRHRPACRAIYLGSRGQYGNATANPIREDTPMVPVDIQGIHKLAAESYYRVFAALHKVPSISLRIPNCFGERQPTAGRDIGLVGGFVREAFAGRDIEVYGRERKRTVVYAGDLAEAIVRLADIPFSGFDACNVGGHHLTIHELATAITEIAGSGRCVVLPIPAEVRAIDAGSAGLDDGRLMGKIGALPRTEFPVALRRTIDWLRTSFPSTLS